MSAKGSSIVAPGNSKTEGQRAPSESSNHVEHHDSSLIATIQDHDERELAQLGYKQVCNNSPSGSINSWSIQELRRSFTKWSTVSYAISILGVLGSVPATFGIPIKSGGPATAVWTWFIGSVMAECIALSGGLAFLDIRQDEALLNQTVAELVSAYPTAGGMYFVTKHVVPPEHVAFWAWIVGWCNFLGQTAGVTSVAFSVSQMMLAAASMRSPLVDGSYSFSP